MREKIEGLSKGMLDGMEEEYGAIHSSAADSSIASSASTSKRIDSYTDPSSTFSTRQQSSQVKSEYMKCFITVLLCLYLYISFKMMYITYDSELYCIISCGVL